MKLHDCMPPQSSQADVYFHVCPDSCQTFKTDKDVYKKCFHQELETFTLIHWEENTIQVHCSLKVVAIYKYAHPHQ